MPFPKKTQEESFLKTPFSNAFVMPETCSCTTPYFELQEWIKFGTQPKNFHGLCEKERRINFITHPWHPIVHFSRTLSTKAPFSLRNLYNHFPAKQYFFLLLSQCPDVSPMLCFILRPIWIIFPFSISSLESTFAAFQLSGNMHGNFEDGEITYGQIGHSHLDQYDPFT